MRTHPQGTKSSGTITFFIGGYWPILKFDSYSILLPKYSECELEIVFGGFVAIKMCLQS